jgi:hypothetical protein
MLDWIMYHKGRTLGILLLVYAVVSFIVVGISYGWTITDIRPFIIVTDVIAVPVGSLCIMLG